VMPSGYFCSDGLINKVPPFHFVLHRSQDFAPVHHHFFIFLLIILCTVFLNFPLPSVCANIKSFFMQSELYTLCPKYSNLLIAFSMTHHNCCEYSTKTADDVQ